MPRERDIEGDREALAEKERDAALDKEIVDQLSNDDDEGEDNRIAREQQEADARRAAAKSKRPEPSDDEIDDDQDAMLAYDLDEDENDPESTRGSSRRARRNRARKAAQEADRSQIVAMSEQINQLKGALDQMSKGQVGLAAGDLDGRIAREQQALNQIDDVLAEAATSQDKATYKQAMRLRDEAKDRLERLGYAKQRLVAEATDTRTQPQTQDAPQQRAPDPIAQRYASKFLERNDWFDPTDELDEDSAILKTIDDTLTREGYKHNTRMFWVELERRSKARGLGQDNEGDDVDEHDERPTPKPRGPGGLPPRSARGAGTRQRSSGFSLTQDMKEALDAEGLLDEKALTDDQKSYRRRLVTQWKDGMAKAAAAGKR